METVDKIRVGVLRGGPSAEHGVSLKSGAAVLQNLPEHYAPIDIHIDKLGRWHTGGVRRPPHKIFPHIDVAFNALHGKWGEDGGIQRLLEAHRVCYTGSGVVASALGMNKVLAKDIFKQNGLRVPHGVVVRRGEVTPEMARNIYRTFPQPSVVKPVGGGSSLGASITHTFQEFFEALEAAAQLSETILIEEYIRGIEATCGILENFRGEEYYALPPIEIIPPVGKFFDYDAKYDGSSRELCPSPNLSSVQKQEIARAAIMAHRALGLRHYSRADFIVSPRGLYILEVNTLPGLTDESLLPKACAAVGCGMEYLFEHLITEALFGR